MRGHQPDREMRYALVGPDHPTWFGKLTRDLISQGAVAEQLHLQPKDFHSCILGKRIFAQMGRQVGFRSEVVDLLARCLRLEIMALQVELLRAERDVFRAIRP